MYIHSLMGRKSTTGARYALGEPWDGMLADFCAAHYGAPQSRVIRDAVKALIEAEIARNPDIRARYEQARADRLGPGKVAPLRAIKD